MAHEKQYPYGYNSMAEYTAYLRCLNKLNLGDYVKIYVNSSNRPTYPSRNVTGYSHVVKIIGIRYKYVYSWEIDYHFGNKVFLLGSNSDGIGFWDLPHAIAKHSLMYGSIQALNNIKKYGYGYWAWPSDIRIKCKI